MKRRRKNCSVKWTKLEDGQLRNLVFKLKEPINWQAIAGKFDSKTDTQCMNRWMFFLNPKIRKGAWTKEVLDLLCLFYRAKWVVLRFFHSCKSPNYKVFEKCLVFSRF